MVFTVEWLNRPDHYGRNRHLSLNLFEEWWTSQGGLVKGGYRDDKGHRVPDVLEGAGMEHSRSPRCG